WELKTNAEGRFLVPNVTDLTLNEYGGPLANVVIQDANWHSVHYAVYKDRAGVLPDVEIEALEGPPPEVACEVVNLGEKTEWPFMQDPAAPKGSATIRVQIEGPEGVEPCARGSISLARIEDDLNVNRFQWTTPGETIQFSELPAGDYRVGYSSFG